MQPIHSSRLLAATLTVLLLSVLPVRHSQAGEDHQISIGEKHKLQSKILGQERTLLVNLPNRYELLQGGYPVLYLLDGAEHFFHVSGLIRFLGTRGRIPEMIVVGIVNIDRNHDFTPTQAASKYGKKAVTGGGAGKFLQFMQQELFPFVEKNYRTQPHRLLVGHSLGGLFATHALLTRPDLFQAHMAISPYLGWDDKVVLKNLNAILKKHQGKNSIFLSYADSGESAFGVDVDTRSLGTALSKHAPKSLTWKVVQLKGEDHGSTVHAAIYQGLHTLYANWRPAPGEDLEGIKRHYRSLSARLGYEIPIPEAMVNLMGYQELGKKNVTAAIEIFKYNLDLHPDSANVYDSLGEAYENNRQLELALKNYRIAVDKLEKIPGHDKRIMKVYREHVSRAKKQMSTRKRPSGS